VRNDVVCSTAFSALAIARALVAIVGIGVLQDDVPGMQNARKDAEAAKCKVDERVCAADSALDPDYNSC
jgi:hypothetical protein